MIDEKFIDFARYQVKDLLGAVWDENKDEAETWLLAVAALQAEIMKGTTPETAQQTQRHLEFGLKCFKRKLLGRLETKTIDVLGSLFSVFLEIAIESGKIALKNKLGGDTWQV